MGVSPTHREVVTVEPLVPTRKPHQKGGIIGSGHALTDASDLDEVAAALTGVGRVLLAGPGSATDGLADPSHSHDRAIGRHVVAVDTVDHPSDRQLVEHARQRFATPSCWTAGPTVMPRRPPTTQCRRR